MMKIKYFKCPICKKKFKTLTGWGDHMKKVHPDSIPEGYTIARYFYYIVTGKTHGICRTCKGDTDWNENSMKYNQYCNDPACKQAYVNIAKNRMVGKYGKVHLLNDPDMQRKMMSHRKISGVYRFHDGTEIPYVAKYEFNFLRMMDTFLHWPTADLMGPSPHNYEYMYKNPNDDPSNEGMKIYIPDFYIPSLNLEIEIKETGTTHPKFIAIDQVKEKLKDEVMKSDPNINYIKIVDNDFSNFFDYLLSLKKEVSVDTEQQPLDKANESYLSLSDIPYEYIANESSKKVPLSEIIDDAKKDIHVDYQFSQIESIFKKMNKLVIGYLIGDGVVYGDKDMSKYHTLTQDQISEKKYGYHFDFTQYQSKLLDKAGFSYQKYFIQIDSDMLKTHSFIIFKIHEGYLYMENYIKSLYGIYYPMGVDEIFNMIINNMQHTYGVNASSFKIYSYEISDKVYPGRPLSDILKYITINGKREYHIYSNDYNAVKVPLKNDLDKSISDTVEK